MGRCKPVEGPKGVTGLIDHAPNPPSTRESAGKIWRDTLKGIPTAFGRLVYLASLRDSTSGYYCEPGLAALIGPEGADRSIRHSHHQVFSEWLGFSLSEQKSDLDEYLHAAGSPRDAPHYRNLVPPTARDVERQLYLTDLETLLELLRYEHGGAFSIPGA